MTFLPTPRDADRQDASNDVQLAQIDPRERNLQDKSHFDPWPTVERIWRGTLFPIARIRAIVGFIMFVCLLCLPRK